MLSGVEATVRGNACSNNTQRGIHIAGSACLVTGNNCSENGADGILVEGENCRIENNNVASNDVGIRTTAASVATRNTAMANTITNFQFSASTSHGPVTVLGFGGIVAADDLANFSF